MAKLSLCMIVKNEEVILSKCLESVQNVVDEMVVMDTGSTDKTVEIAQKFGAVVPTFPWGDDFAEARNEALKYVTGDWVLVLDADEVLNQKVAPQIKEAIAKEENLVVNLVRHEIGSSQSPYSLVSRLFRKHPEVNFARPYHAIIDDSVSELLKKENHWKIVDLPAISVFHYGYTPGAIASLNKYNRAQTAMESFIKEHPNDPYTCSKLGALYAQIGKEKQAIKLFKQGLKSNKADIHVLYELHYHLGNLYAKQEDKEKAIKHYQKAIEQPIMAPLKLGSHNNIGVVLQSMGDYKNAAQAYETTLKIDPTFITGYYNFAMTLTAMGRLADAVAIYEKLISLTPNYAAAYQNLGVVFFKLNKLPESSEAFKKAISLYEEQNNQVAANKLRNNLKELGLWEE
ncbi:tetratricopeptide repeat protein [Crocosphaera sp.]|uniref:tetratricopeptide repeat protein n=1 Tax=Crocosphaera sp. TaxID=2729996 RepID=UPI002608290B|nr:tetratricopeptide repeat protein [Crocosphaera sp.]MDJ0579951.1 tetratricopeptide repeat protein [Crocosphaera sp.]